jgi:hypothetical protein
MIKSKFCIILMLVFIIGMTSDEEIRYVDKISKEYGVLFSGAGCEKLRIVVPPYKSGAKKIDDEVLGKCLIFKSRIESIRISSPFITEKGFQGLEDCSGLVDLDISNVRFEVTSASVLSKLGKLEVLQINNANINGKTMSKISGLKKLKLLSVSNNNNLDDDLTCLESLVEIEFLNLSYTKITDKGLSIISNQKHDKLKTIVLTGNKITDKGAIYLKKIPSLKEIYLEDTMVTEKMVSQLQIYFKDALITSNESRIRSQD